MSEVETHPIADDLLWGAEAIADALYGDGKKYRRRIFALRKNSRLPIGRVGGRLFIRRSALLAYLAEEETR